MESRDVEAVTFEQAAVVLAAQPFSVLLGARLVSFGGGSAQLQIGMRRDLEQQNGFAHGGVIAYAADNAITFAAGSVLGAAVLTRGLTIDYLHPGKGDYLRVNAHVISQSLRGATCRAEVFAVTGDTEVLCAVAQGSVREIGVRRDAADAD